MQVGALWMAFVLKPDASWSKATKLIGGLKAAAAGLLAFTGAKRFVGWIEEAASAGTHIIGLSKQFGISAQSVQEWGYIAKQSGSNIK